MKTVLFVPGFKEDFATRDYVSVLRVIESKGYKATFVPIDWSRTVLQDWIKELNTVYTKHDPAETILAGFSFGSLAAFMCAVEKNPAELWLFSLSPYFSDDMPHMKKSWLAYIGHRRAERFRALDFDSLSQRIQCPTLLVTGDVEAKKYPLIAKRSKTAQKKLANSRLAWVSGADHDVSDERYLSIIKKMI